MTTLPAFKLEAFFSKWEFTARYHLSASDAQTTSMADLVAMADADDRAAWENLDLGYTQTFGDPLLRKAIAETFEHVEAEDVITFAGAQEGVLLGLQVLLGPGDHAVVVTPCYQSAETIALSLCEVTGVALRPERDWALDLDELTAALRPETRLVYINFPNNPTGKLLSHNDFKAIVELCDARGIVLFSDEVHRGLELDPARTLAQAADLSQRAMSLGVTSKALGLPGLRVGWIACRDKEILARLELAKHYTTICTSAPSEVLARIAIKARDRLLARNRELVTRNLQIFGDFFAEFADLFEWSAPDGGCVAFPRYRGGEGIEQFCGRLVEETGVLLVPSTIFASELTPTPADRFRIGIGRSDPEPALAAFSGWLRDHPHA
ncbi:aminotransferase class I/II-fold pyridoxal phosphate-dependent enzyme [Allokutzneria sp. A3M-2-11 16]|uniref:aminotransferase class I/II-fold pyridoxal phosphate-dependent enzyme n=1 Tax=Allokutzneria sp. A3M-2-11 16 TaxID=2962043 RepID=UPI0020B7F75E|nr:aminotransferase class I/II-fold pyridoxal phosphate-dependent enzyme [Allokutzneria sp. A3M-2-11 16]MCP3804521.1 aminotransferase class I/II-fold pyridoxal phosphate-dependent enzyme [Allokutzneria sp. A3M-2-11 16]